MNHPDLVAALTARFGSILLKKSASVSPAVKYVPEIEICVLRKRFRTRISRSNVQKRCFHPSVFERFGQTDFFNTIGRFLPFRDEQKNGQKQTFKPAVSISSGGTEFLLNERKLLIAY